MSKMTKGVLFGFFLLFFAGSIWLIQSYREDYKTHQNYEQLLYIPSGKFLKTAALGYDQVVSDFLWIKTISYFGLHAVTDRDYTYLPNLLEAVTTLDPYWDFPYHFAGVVLSVEADYAEISNQILKKGMERFPNIWQFPFYAGFNFFHVLDNPRCGAQYIYRASITEGAPDYLAPLAVKLSSQGNTRENHVKMCRNLIKITKDESLKERIIERCKEKLQGNMENRSSSSDRGCL